MNSSSTKKIDIALQGGGAHGAFTWGILDRLLDDERIEIEGISGTSAGAMNAVALAQGLADGGRKASQELRAIAFLWEIIQHEGLERQAYRDGRLHMIQSEEEMQKLSVSSKINSEWVFLKHLHDIGWRAAENWLSRHFDDLGERTSWRPTFVYEESLRPAHLPEGAERKKTE
jgi:predicted acylesterase/phospholipase RssA